MDDSACTIYALLDRGEPFYIGATTRPRFRLTNHVSVSKGNGRTPVQVKIKQMLSIGVKPEFKVIEICSKDISGERERFWIHQYSLDYPGMVNVKHGNPSKPYRPAKEGFTVLRITSARHEQLRSLRRKLQAEHDKSIDLQEVVDFVLATGLQALGVHANSATPASPIISQSSALVNEQ